jgi:hypothetical protein
MSVDIGNTKLKSNELFTENKLISIMAINAEISGPYIKDEILYFIEFA